MKRCKLLLANNNNNIRYYSLSEIVIGNENQIIEEFITEMIINFCSLNHLHILEYS